MGMFLSERILLDQKDPHPFVQSVAVSGRHFLLGAKPFSLFFFSSCVVGDALLVF